MPCCHELRESAGVCSSGVVRYISYMQLCINGERKNYTGVATLLQLIGELGMKGDRVAVELNREIVPRERWDNVRLQDGDQLEIVHFVGGG
jgi:sulfur carrier protein